MAGGATYSESRACYEVSKTSGRDIFLTTSHMLTPGLYVRQVGDLSVDRRRLDLPQDRPKPKAPPHLFERNDPPKPAVVGAGMGGPGSRQGVPTRKSPAAPLPTQNSHGYVNRPPTAALAAMSMNSNDRNPVPLNGNGGAQSGGKGVLSKPKDEGGEKEKKKRGFFGHKK